MKAEYDAVEEQVDLIEDSIEHYKSKLNETNLLKQQLENQIALLKEQINTARMNDEHLEQRSKAIYAELARQPFALGDIGADGAINAVDAASILVESAVLGSGGGTIFSDFELMQADVNLDGTMNAEDAAIILSYAAECASGNFSGSLIAFQS